MKTAITTPPAAESAHTPAIMTTVTVGDPQRFVDERDWRVNLYDRHNCRYIGAASGESPIEARERALFIADAVNAHAAAQQRIVELTAELEEYRGRVVPDSNQMLADLGAKLEKTERHLSGVIFRANVLACAKGKSERDAAALKVFCAIGEAKDDLPGLLTLDELRLALRHPERT